MLLKEFLPKSLAFQSSFITVMVERDRPDGPVAGGNGANEQVSRPVENFPHGVR